MAKLKTIRLKAFTILETMVALTIVLLMFGMMSSLLIQINKGSYSSRKLKAHELLNSFIISMNQRDTFYNSTINIDGYILRSQCAGWEGYPNLVKSKFEIYDERGGLIEQESRFIIS
jgi:type II secretory pathway pseudopilin PulG